MLLSRLCALGTAFVSSLAYGGDAADSMVAVGRAVYIRSTYICIHVSLKLVLPSHFFLARNTPKLVAPHGTDARVKETKTRKHTAVVTGAERTPFLLGGDRTLAKKQLCLFSAHISRTVGWALFSDRFSLKRREVGIVRTHVHQRRQTLCSLRPVRVFRHTARSSASESSGRDVDRQSPHEILATVPGVHQIAKSTPVHKA